MSANYKCPQQQCSCHQRLIHIRRGLTLEGSPTAVGRLPTAPAVARGRAFIGRGRSEAAEAGGTLSSSSGCLRRPACLGWTESAKRMVGVRVAFASLSSFRRCAALDIVAEDSASASLLGAIARILATGEGDVTRPGAAGAGRSEGLTEGTSRVSDSAALSSSLTRARIPRSRSLKSHSGKSDG